MEWKAVANAIIHDGYDPRIKAIVIACNKCGCQGHYVHYENIDSSYQGDPTASTGTYLISCANCGAKELNVIGCKELPALLPEKFFPFIGNFLLFMGHMFMKCQKLDNLPKELTEPTIEVDAEVAWRKVMAQTGKVHLTRDEINEFQKGELSWPEIAEIISARLPPEDEDLRTDAELSRLHLKLDGKHLLVMPKDEIDLKFKILGGS